MFQSNLQTALDHKGITDKAVCSLLGISQKSLYNKKTGATEFTVGEAIKIVDNLLPEYRFQYLFGRGQFTPRAEGAEQ